MHRTAYLLSVLFFEKPTLICFLKYIFPLTFPLELFSLCDCVICFLVLLLVFFSFTGAARPTLRITSGFRWSSNTRFAEYPTPGAPGLSFTTIWWMLCMTHPTDLSSLYRRCKQLQGFLDAEVLWQPGQSFILAGFILSLPRPVPCGSERLIHRERPAATQHSLHNYVGHLAALPTHTQHCEHFDINLVCDGDHKRRMTR